ncbi:Hypothetical_protein [Hexamita inflata]|uniref:Hypothetical_protein n=1 Tax=Hexamita inflata TaxID=28002 RepID=A0AA86TTM6_9EUKA|nr:Hypothetical protein HINF_LOCUS9378 [Hexamita inflata]
MLLPDIVIIVSAQLQMKNIPPKSSFSNLFIINSEKKIVFSTITCDESFKILGDNIREIALELSQLLCIADEYIVVMDKQRLFVEKKYAQSQLEPGFRGALSLRDSQFIKDCI